MATRKFRFVSPGVFLKEIDLSQLPGQAPGIGPILIGRTRQGPAMKPYKVKDLEEFQRVFGTPMPGNEGLDPWRDGTSLLAESYVPYAARAHFLAGEDTPVTVVRLAGVTGDDASPDSDGEPGWIAEDAWGLFVFSYNHGATVGPTASLAAVFYGAPGSGFEPKIVGTPIYQLTEAGALVDPPNRGANREELDAGKAAYFNNSGRLTIRLSSSAGLTKDVHTLLSEIREDFNTNPVMTNTRIMSPPASSLASQYWLGETFENTVRKLDASVTEADDYKAAVIVKLKEGMDDFRGNTHELKSARTGWVTAQDTSRNITDYSAERSEKLFRFVALHEGTESARNLMVSIEDIRIPREGAIDPYGTFSVVVKKIIYGRARLEEIERFDNCNLDPSSDNHIAKQIGDQYLEWSSAEKRNRVRESNINISEYIRVEMDSLVRDSGPSSPSLVPFGFLGPVRPREVKIPLSGGAATAEVQFTTATAGDLDNGPDLTLVSTDGTSRVYKFNNGGGQANGEALGNDEIRVNVAGGTSPNDFAIKLKQAIESEDAHSGKITATVLNDTVTLTQVVGGNASNTVIPAVVGGALNKFTVNGVIDATQFAGGGTSSNAIPTTSFITGNMFLNAGSSSLEKMRVNWADFPLVNSASKDEDFYMGATPFLQTHKTGSLYGHREQTTEINRGYVDLVRRYGTLENLTRDQDDGTADGNYSSHAFSFSLDDVVLHLTEDSALPSVRNVTRRQEIAQAVWSPGSKNKGDAGIASAEAAGASFSGLISRTASGSFALRPLLEVVKGFNMPLVGGSDGVNIVEANPFNNDVTRNRTTRTSYAYASIDRAIDLISDPEVVEHNLAAMPGITNVSLTNKLVKTCESRADSLAIIDLPDVYVPPSEKKCDDFRDRTDGTDPERSANNLVKRQLNSSYGATYYPWVKIRDNLNSRDVWVPPSVPALGAMAYTERTSEVWFAPAGFNRGGLNQGTAGVPVLQVSEHLMSKDRDTLYEANINPIASFVSEGIVIFGQKTLQSTKSALDRINVRRLMIFIKKEVSRICNTLLFEQNVAATWSRFTSRVVPFLESVKVRFGLSDFKVVLDDTTTTPDLVDRNIMYAKIFLKPARAIEFIAVDFIITNTGAEFDD